jgi:hypothetical protein
MLKKIISSLLVIGFTATGALQAEPTPAPQKKATKPNEPVSKTVSAAPQKTGWSLVKGVWVHPDGYKFVQGRVIRTDTQTQKRPPKPPTQAEMDAATRKKSGPPSPAEIAAAKAAERERNLRPQPRRQTGTNL